MSRETELPLTIIALARREADHIAACFRSLEPLIKAGAHTLIVLDSNSDDRTASVAHSVARRVVVREFVNFSIQRNHGLDAVHTEWVFFIDADERCTALLARQILVAITRPDCAAYRVPRRNILFGREVRHTGWSPDYQIRLLRRELCRYDPNREVHELPLVNGRICDLTARLVHYNYETWGQFIAKQRAYATLEAQAHFRAGRRATLKSLVGQPLRELKRRLIDYRGYKDGLLGLALSIAMALHVLDTRRRLFILQRKAKSARNE